ncbi:MAG: glycosyltransferase family 2 protein [Armatimonadetes bacterium]|nr:glycosyltransferase family 2 protein [Armatimonadota bacterium]
MTPTDAQSAALDLTVSILSWNTRDLLRRCLGSIYHPAWPPVRAARERAGLPCDAVPEEISFEVVVVDQESLDRSARMVAEEFPQVRLLARKGNLGFAGGNNLAYQHARGRYFLLLNSDTVLRPGALTALVRFADAHPRAGLIGPKVLNPNGSLQLSCRRFPTLGAGLFRHTPLGILFPKNRFVRKYLMDDWTHDQPQEVDWLSGCCLLARREMIEEIGLLDDGFFMYFEDVDWAVRAHRAGWQVLYYPEPLVIHEIGRSTDKAVKRMIVRHHLSAYRFFTKHYPSTRRPLVRGALIAGLAVRCALTLARNQALRWKLKWSQRKSAARKSRKLSEPRSGG